MKKIIILHDDKDEQHLVGEIKNLLNKRYSQGKLMTYDVKIEREE